MHLEILMGQVIELTRCKPVYYNSQYLFISFLKHFSVCVSMSGDSASPTLASCVITAKSDSKYVKLNVGGTLHLTTIDTLCKQDTMLRAMFSGRMDVLHDKEGQLLLSGMELF